MKAKVYVNRYKIREGKAPIAVRTSRGVRYVRHMALTSGVIKYDPDKCPRVWVETTIGEK